MMVETVDCLQALTDAIGQAGGGGVGSGGKAPDQFDIAVQRMRGNVDERFTMNSCANGLAAMLQDSSLPVPLLMGVHGKHGSGKTRLIKAILWRLGRVCGFSCSNLGRPMRSADVRWRYDTCCCRMPFFSYLLLLVVLFAFVAGGVVAYMVWAGVVYHENDIGGGRDGHRHRPPAAPVLNESSVSSSGLMAATPDAMTAATAKQAAVTSGVVGSDNDEATLGNDVRYPLLAASAFAGAAVLLVLVAVVAYYCRYCRPSYGLASENDDDAAAAAAAADGSPPADAGGWWRQLQLVLVMLLCETPPRPVVRKHDKVEVIPVLFNAWEYAGCDVLWAGIIKNIFDQVESAFGKWKLRFYRTFHSADLSHEHDAAVADASLAGHASDIASYFGDSVNSAKRDDDCNGDPRSDGDGADDGSAEMKAPAADATRHRRVQERCPLSSPTVRSSSSAAASVMVHTAKWMHVPYPVLALLAASAAAVSAVVLVLFAVASRQRTLHDVEERVRLAAGALLGLTAASQLGNAWSLLRSVWMSQSQSLDRAVRRVSGRGPDLSADLGFMHTVKSEVQRVTGFIKLMERLYRKQFRVLIIVDDLDRCEPARMRSILEAVSILLSDDDSLFVTLIAIDHNVVSRAIGGGDTGDGAAAAAEYLHRLVQVRFCIPEWTVADVETALDRSLCRHDRRAISMRRWAHRSDNGWRSGIGGRRMRCANDLEAAWATVASRAAEIPWLVSSMSNAAAEAQLKAKLRRRMTKLATQEIRRRMDVLPTSFHDVRHLCNMVFFTVYLWVDKIHIGDETLESLQHALADMCLKLTWWVVLTEEWPYRCSWILKHIDDMNELSRRPHRLGNRNDHTEQRQQQTLLSEVYSHVKERIKEPENWKRWISNDGSADHFEAALDACPLTVYAVRNFLPFTINLDRAIKHHIIEHCKTLESELCPFCVTAASASCSPSLSRKFGSRETLSGASSCSAADDQRRYDGAESEIFGC